ncbi:hypothetical protein N9M66_00985 [Litoreibacter sp.]|nr:hypothetical protein [Litoreibacter sp.]
MRKRIIQFMHEYSPDLILVLAAIAIFAVAPKLLTNVLGNEATQSSVNFAIKIIATVLAVAGSIASYRRFFRGRVFAPRLRMSLTHSIVTALSDGSILHAVDIEAENVGGVTIWNPALDVHVFELETDVDCTIQGTATDGIRQVLRPGGISGIEPAETVVYHHRFRVSKDLEAFRISTELSVDRRDAWHRSMTVANSAPTKS